MSETNRGHHRPDNDENLRDLHIISDVSVADRQVAVSRAKRNHKHSQKGETDEQNLTRPPVAKGSRVIPDCPHGRQKYRCVDYNGAGVCPHGRRKYRCLGVSIFPHGQQKFRCLDYKHKHE